MSGKNARAARKTVGPPVSHHANAEDVIATANRVLSLALAGIATSWPRQILVGWLRSSFEQSRVIATLTAAGLAHAAGPNRRNFFETMGRLLWLREMPQADRAGVFAAMIKDDDRHARNAVKHLSDMGFDHKLDLAAVDELMLEISSAGPGVKLASFMDAAKATQGRGAAFYYAWREETQYTHATATLAAAYAPDRDGMIGSGRPPVTDPDLELQHLASMLIATLTYGLLRDEGVADRLARPIFEAAFGAGGSIVDSI